MASKLPPGGISRIAKLPSKLRHFSSGTVMDRSNSASSVEPVQSPAETISSNSTIKGSSPTQKACVDCVCTVTVAETISKDEVQMNLDFFDKSIEPGSMMALYPLRSDQDRSHSGSRRQSDCTFSGIASRRDVDPKRYLLILVKDMSKELKSRHPNTELYVAQNFAGLYGLKRGSRVLLTSVSEQESCFPDSTYLEFLLTVRPHMLMHSESFCLAIILG